MQAGPSHHMPYQDPDHGKRVQQRFLHASEPTRQDSIGAVLLDRDNPPKILRRTRDPILQAEK